MTTCSSWPRSAFTRPRFGGTTTLDLDVLADEASQHARHPVHDVVEIEDLGNERLFAAEGQELPGQRGGPLGRLPDLLRPCPRGDPGASPLEEDVAVAEDDREEVVEVVGHAAGQAADRLHLLGLAELLLQAAPVGDVGEHPEGAGEPSVGIEDGCAGNEAPTFLSVLPSKAPLVLLRDALAARVQVPSGLVEFSGKAYRSSGVPSNSSGVQPSIRANAPLANVIRSSASMEQIPSALVSTILL